MKNENALKQRLFVGMTFFFLFATALRASAQNSNQQIVSLNSKISQDSFKLAKMKALLPQYESDKKSTANQAQQSADDNKTAANRLSNDPQAKKLARKADNAASDARSDARKARKAADKLTELNKDIDKLTYKIEKERAKLEKVVRTQATTPVNTTSAAQKDSTQ
jgi:hypothetical protein